MGRHVCRGRWRCSPCSSGTFVIVLVLNRTAGSARPKTSIWGKCSSTPSRPWPSALCWWRLSRPDPQVTAATPFREALGKMVYEASPFSHRRGVGRPVPRRPKGRDEGRRRRDGPDDERHQPLADIGATLLGAAFVAFNIAPTDEVPLITAAMSPAWIVGAVGVSLAVSYGMVFEAGFSDQVGPARADRGDPAPAHRDDGLLPLALVAVRGHAVVLPAMAGRRPVRRRVAPDGRARPPGRRRWSGRKVGSVSERDARSAGGVDHVRRRLDGGRRRRLGHRDRDPGK